MMKYEFELELINNNCLSWIIEQLTSNSVVLEFGPATGRLTRYMKEQLNCKVYLVELDEEAGKKALQYGEDLVIGDIEDYVWLERYQDIRFDFIIFADVLEHLRNPEKVLVRAKHLLKPEGTILLSVPNFAHNSVLINLLNNEFEYTSTGLLDNTHIHMFTKKSLENMLQRADLHVTKRIGTYSKVGTNEILNSIEDVPEIDKSYWLTRDYGEIYQFVYAVKKSMEYVTEECNELLKQNRNYYAQLFTGDGGSKEDNSVKVYIENMKELQRLVFHNVEHGTTLRFDPLNAACIVAIEKVIARTADSSRELKVIGTNAEFTKGTLFVFSTSDPIVELGVDFEDKIETLEITARILLSDEKRLKEICKCIDEADVSEEYWRDKFQQQETELLNLQAEFAKLQNVYQQIVRSKRWKLANLFRMKK